jgi:hypothetical protein
MVTSGKLRWADLDLVHGRTVRSLAIRSYASFLSTGASILALFHWGAKSGFFPDVNVEINPKSTDFGRITWGNQRIDFWAGYQPLVRYGSQFATEQSKGQGGRMIERSRMDTALRLGQSKLSPIVGLAVDLGRQRTFTGDVMELTPGSISNQAYNRLTPMFTQDLAEALKDHGATGLITAPFMFMGMSSVVYDGVKELGLNIIRNEKPDEYRRIQQLLRDKGLPPIPTSLHQLTPVASAYLDTHTKFLAAMHEARINSAGRTPDHPVWASLNQLRSQKLARYQMMEDVLNGNHWKEDKDELKEGYEKFENYPRGGTIPDATFHKLWTEHVAKDLFATAKTILDSPEADKLLEKDPLSMADIMGEKYHSMAAENLVFLPNGEFDWDGYNLAQVGVVEEIRKGLGSDILPNGPIVFPKREAQPEVRDENGNVTKAAVEARRAISMVEYVTGRSIDPDTQELYQIISILDVPVRIPTRLIDPDLSYVGNRFPKDETGEPLFPLLTDKVRQSDHVKLLARELSWRIPNQILEVLPGNVNDSKSPAGRYSKYLQGNSAEQNYMSKTDPVVKYANGLARDVRNITRKLRVPYLHENGEWGTATWDAISVRWDQGAVVGKTLSGQIEYMKRVIGPMSEFTQPESPLAAFGEFVGDRQDVQPVGATR